MVVSPDVVTNEIQSMAIVSFLDALVGMVTEHRKCVATTCDLIFSTHPDMYIIFTRRLVKIIENFLMKNHVSADTRCYFYQSD